MSRARIAAWISLSAGGLAAVPAHAQDANPAETTLPPAPYAGRVLNWPGKTHPGIAPHRPAVPQARSVAAPMAAEPARQPPAPAATAWAPPPPAAIISVPQPAAGVDSRYGPAREAAPRPAASWTAATPSAPDWRPPRLAPRTETASAAPTRAPPPHRGAPPPRPAPVQAADADLMGAPVARALKSAPAATRQAAAAPSASPIDTPRAPVRPVAAAPAPAPAGLSARKPAVAVAAAPAPGSAAVLPASSTALAAVPFHRAPVAPAAQVQPAPPKLASRGPSPAPVPTVVAEPRQAAADLPSRLPPAMMMGAPRRPWNERYGMDAVAHPAPAPQPVMKTKGAKLAKGAHPPPAARPVQTAQASARAMPSREATVHFYSVHRDFGIQPTPAPIPPQFFGPTSDLSEPEGPQAIPAQTTGKGALAARARAEAETSAPD